MSENIQFIDLETQNKRLRPAIDRSIQRVLDHGTYIMGPEIFELEQRLQQFCGAKHAITCSNGTDALLLILKALDIGHNDAIFLPSFTFAATAEVVALLGAVPVFIDSALDSYNMDPESLELGIKTAQQAKLTPKAVISVDLFGQPVDYDAIEIICGKHNLLLVSDAAQSFGAKYKDRKIGTIGIATATSFYPAKPLGCYGDGGAIFTNNDELSKIIQSLRVHGQGEHKYDNLRIGFNGRLDTLQAAILLEKLKIFPEELEKRTLVAKHYNEHLSSILDVPLITDAENITSAWAQYTVLLNEKISRDRVMSALKEKGVPTVIYYPKPLHLQPAYNMYPVAMGGLPNAEYLANHVLSLPMHPYLVEKEQNYVINCLKDFLLASERKMVVSV